LIELCLRQHVAESKQPNQRRTKIMTALASALNGADMRDAA
jgi:hypothetical protein